MHMQSFQYAKLIVVLRSKCHYADNDAIALRKFIDRRLVEIRSVRDESAGIRTIVYL
jgi:hypothetical protein